MRWLLLIWFVLRAGTSFGAIIDTLDLGDTELWVVGKEISGPRVVASWDGERLWFNDVPVTVKVPSLPLSDSSIVRIYGHTPKAEEMRKGGLSALEAAKEYRRLYYELGEQMRDAMERSGRDSAIAIARRSELVTKVDTLLEYDVLLVDCWGMGRQFWDLKRPPPQKEVDWEAVARGIVSKAKYEKALVFISAGGSVLLLFDGPADDARRQIRYVLEGGDLRSVPNGPLQRDDPPLSEILAAHGL